MNELRIGINGHGLSSQVVQLSMIWPLYLCSLKYLEIESLSDQQVLMEKLMLGLRQRKGVGLHSMLYLFVEGEQERVLKQLELLEKEKLVTLQDGRVALTLEGMPLGNEIVLTLL